MYIKLTEISNWTFTDKICSADYIKVADPTNQYTGRDLKTGYKLYCYCLDSSGMKNVLAIYTLDSFTKATASKVTAPIFTRINDYFDTDGNQIDNNTPISNQGFICSSTNNVDDIPNADAFSLSGILTDTARNYNLANNVSSLISTLSTQITKLENKQYYTQIIDTTKLVANEEAEEGKKYAVALDYYPLSDVTLEINGISYNENDNNDFVIERNVDTQTATVYFDAEQDDFTITDLQDLSTDVRLKYTAIVITQETTDETNTSES